MTTEAMAGIHHVTVSGIQVEVVRKDIKNLHLGVYPPNGRVRVAAPLVVSDEAVRLAVIDKLGWIRRQKAKFAEQPRQSQREMVNGESHYFMGQRYLLRVRVHEGPPHVQQCSTTFLDLHIRPETSIEQRQLILQRWYREQLRLLIPPLLAKWQPILGVQAAKWGIKRMKTRWGTCNTITHQIWLNLELIKKPVHCLEYIIVHELTHLLERNHTDRFNELMDQHLPQWRLIREELNHTPLGYEEWAK